MMGLQAAARSLSRDRDVSGYCRYSIEWHNYSNEKIVDEAEAENVAVDYYGCFGGGRIADGVDL